MARTRPGLAEGDQLARRTKGPTMRKVFVVTSVLLLASGVVQLYFAAFGVFSKPENFDPHGINGSMILPALAVLNIIGAAIARAGGRTIGLSVLPLVLILFQTVLFIITGAIFNVGPESETVPVGASILLGLHGLNGLAIIGVSGALLTRALRLDRTGSATSARSQERVATTTGS